MEKMNNGQDQMDNFSRERETVRKNDMEILEMKNTDIEIKSTFDGLITLMTQLDTAEEGR